MKNKFSILIIMSLLIFFAVPLVSAANKNYVDNVTSQQTLTQSALAGYFTGGTFIVNQNATLNSAISNISTACTECNQVYLLKNVSNVFTRVANATWVSGVANFSSQKYNVYAGERYYLAYYVAGAGTIQYASNGGASLPFPYVGSIINITGGAYNNTNTQPTGVTNQIWGFQNITFDVIPPGNFTITANDYYNGVTLYNLSAIINLSNGSNYNYSTTTGQLNTTILTNYTGLANITLNCSDNGGYFPQTSLNYNISSNLADLMWQAEVYTNPIPEVVTGTNLAYSGGTLSAPLQTIANTVGQFLRLAAGTYNITFNKAGYYLINDTVTVGALSNITNDFTPNFPYNASLNFTTKNSITGATINTFSEQIANVTYNFVSGHSTTNGIIQDNLTYSVSYNYTLSAPGYFNAQGTITLSQNQTNLSVQMYPMGYQQVNFVNTVNASLIYSPPSGTVLFQNATTQVNFSGINGTFNISGLSPGSTYSVMCQESSGFANATYSYTYPLVTQTPSPFTCYMQPSASVITYTIQDPNQNRIANANVNVQQFVNGTMTTVCTGTSDVTGTVVCNLLQGVYTSTTSSLNGYTTVNLVNYLASNAYSIVMNPTSQTNPNSNIASFVNYLIQPSGFDLYYNQTMMFNLTVSPYSGTNLTNWGINIYTLGHQLLARINSTNASGGLVSVPLNLTPYNGTVLNVEYFFTKQNYTTFTVPYNYNIVSGPYSGTTDELRDWLANNMDPIYRIFLWIFLSICVILGFRAYNITGQILATVALCTFGFFGYLFSIPVFLLTFILLIGAIIVVVELLGVG